jgi:hypothetical protein
MKYYNILTLISVFLIIISIAFFVITWDYIKTLNDPRNYGITYLVLFVFSIIFSYISTMINVSKLEEVPSITIWTSIVAIPFTITIGAIIFIMWMHDIAPKFA